MPPTPRTSPTIGSPTLSAAAPRPADALELTLEPVAPEAFLARHWQRRPLFLARDEPGRFDAVLSVADVERLVCQTALRMPAFRLVRDGAELPRSSYTTDIPWRPSGFAATAVVDRVAAEHAAGATIVVQGLHLHWHPAAVYCRQLEIALGWPVQANAYSTPASARGFAVHHDTHDVLVLQVAGRKRWRLYEPLLELPLRDQRWSSDLGDPGAPVDDIVMQAGDTLYVPRGWPHEAAADADSLHITVGLHPPTRLDALRDALGECAGDVEFRRALDDDGELPPELLERLAARLRPDAVAARARRRFVDSRRAVLADQLAQLRALDALRLTTPLERRATVIGDLEPGDGGGAMLRFEGKTVSFPPQAAAAVAFAHGAGATFCAAELPGSLDAAGRLVLVRRLVREGFLRVARPGATAA